MAAIANGAAGPRTGNFLESLPSLTQSHLISALKAVGAVVVSGLLTVDDDSHEVIPERERAASDPLLHLHSACKIRFWPWAMNLLSRETDLWHREWDSRGRQLK